jgi:chromosome segregation ATPase
MDYEKELNTLRDNLDKAKNLKYKAEARLEQLNHQQQEIIKELEELGVNPEDLEEEIKNLKGEIDKLFYEANALLPKDILEKK